MARGFEAGAVDVDWVALVLFGYTMGSRPREEKLKQE